jgi:transposase
VTPPPPNQPSDDDRSATTIPLEAFAALQAENAMLRARVLELERRLGLDSSNSGKPPSSDGLKKKPSRVRSLRERSDKKSGGQKGHPGETLRQTATPDEVADHFAPTCSGCGASLADAVPTDYTAR